MLGLEGEAMGENVVPIVILSWIASAILGTIVGSQKDAGEVGLALGLIFGPLGVIASFALDGRRECYRCNSRVNGRPMMCPYCNAELEWERNRSMSPEAAAREVVEKMPVIAHPTPAPKPQAKPKAHVLGGWDPTERE